MQVYWIIKHCGDTKSALTIVGRNQVLYHSASHIARLVVVGLFKNGLQYLLVPTLLCLPTRLPTLSFA